MTAMTIEGAAEPAAAIAMAALDPPHEHTRYCYWDFRECRWQCPPAGEPAVKCTPPNCARHSVTSGATEPGSQA
jgi:hypothetical protein